MNTLGLKLDISIRKRPEELIVLARSSGRDVNKDFVAHDYRRPYVGLQKPTSCMSRSDCNAKTRISKNGSSKVKQEYTKAALRYSQTVDGD